MAAVGLAFNGSAASLSDPEVDRYNVHVGTQTFAGLYQFSTNSQLVETAQAIRGLGSDTIKLYLGSNYPRQYNYSLAPGITNLVSLTRDDPSCRSVLDMPFHNIIAWAYPFSNSDAPFLDGNYTSVEQTNDYRELYDLAQYFLTNYNNSGKTFFLGHWEGDGYLNVNNWSTNPGPAVIQGMIGWENIRQKAIDDAKAHLSFTNVNVYYYAEANRVRDAMLNGPNNNQRVINTVVPYVTNLDFVSYSSYDAMNLDSASLYSTLDYMTSKLPPAKAAGLGQRLWIGEYGWGDFSTDAQEPLNRAYLQRLLGWGPKFILFWEIYNNEPNRNFCLVDSNGTKVASYYLHQRFVNLARLQVARFKQTNSRLPADSEFAALVGPALGQPLPQPTPITVLNLTPTISGSSAVLTGQITQNIYGDDQATVWVFWGTQDGGTVQTNWQSSRLLGINTNFNPATFSATLDSLIPQTNYFFRFYATNASDEAWSPASALLSTQTINPLDYGSRMKITVSAYSRSENLIQVPALIQLSTNIPGFSYSQFASSLGGDLRFADSGGSSPIPHEIDEWDAAGTSFVWVLVPQLSGTNDFVWAYWGNPLAINPPTSNLDRLVWSAKYQSVWHLSQKGFPYLDSARSNNVSAGNVPGFVKAIAGHGSSFDGSALYLDAGRVDLTGAFTLSAWIKIDPAASGIQTIYANKKGGWNSDGFALYVNSYLSTDHRLLFETGDGTNGLTASTSVNAVTSGVWHQVAAVVEPAAGSARLYVDGFDRTQNSAIQSDFSTDADLNIGRFIDGNYYFTGSMDELRLRKGPASVDELWVDWMMVAQTNILLSYAPITIQQFLLSVSHGGGNLLAAWASAAIGSALYSATNLESGSLWTRVTNLPSLIGGQWQITLPIETNSTKFFRLRAP